MFSLRQPAFTDAVIGVFGEAAFFHGQLLEFAFGRARAFGLPEKASAFLKNLIDPRVLLEKKTPVKQKDTIRKPS